METKRNITPYSIIIIAILVSAIAYSIFYFNYFETPTGDFIGNIRPRVVEYNNGQFPGKNYKFLPVYPLLLTVLSKLNPVETGDHIYLTALILNIILFIPYIILTFFIFKKFLSEKAAAAALIFLSVNIYTVYTSVNSELEMLLALLSVLTIFLALRDSKLAYLTAFLAAGTKWDSVFAVPAAMFRDFFYHKKRIVSILLGTAASVGVIIWFTLSIIHTKGSTNPYIAEISHRGPNVYRYIIDCFLVTSGFIQWMGIHGYFSEKLNVTIALYAFIVVPSLVLISGMIWGAVLFFKQKLKEAAPLLVFFLGFLLIHLVYQNTKSRYVLPILWILTLFLFYGISEGLMPWLKGAFSKLSEKAQISLLRFSLLISITLYTVSLGMIFLENSPFHVLFAIIFTFLAALAAIFGVKIESTVKRSSIILTCGIIINLMVFYGVRTMDHYSLRRVEFKKAALWYKDNAVDTDKMLITETNIPIYYTGFSQEKFMISFLIKSEELHSLAEELKKNNITYVFVDDFYIKRYKYKDKNAIDRKAHIFKKIRDKGEKSGHFKLVETFVTKGNIKSYLYRFVP